MKIVDKKITRFDGDAESLAEIVSSSQLSGNADVIDRYEQDLARWFGVEFAVAMSSGTAALHAALHALDIGPGDEILVPAIGTLPSIMPLLTFGAVPVFVDSDPFSFNLSATDIERKLTSKTKAAMSVLQWGYPCENKTTFSVLSEHNIPLIEDAAQAHGSLYGEKKSGTLGRFGCFSTHDRKPLSTGEGGFVLVDDEELAQKLKTYVRIGDMRGDRYGVNFKLSALQGALGLNRLKYLNNTVAHNREMAGELIKLLDPSVFSSPRMDEQSVPNYYGIVLFVDRRPDQVEKIIDHCLEFGIPSDIRKYGIQPSYKRPIFKPKESPNCPNSVSLLQHMITLPMHSGIEARHVLHMADVLNKAVQVSGY